MDNFVKFWSSNFLVQVFSKMISFISNQLLVRSLDPSLFGIWSVRLALVQETIVFWARDGIRKAASRSQNPHKFAILPFLIGLIVSPIIVYISLKSAPEVEGYTLAVIMTAMSSVMELIGEMWAVPQLAVMDGSTTAKVSGPAFLVRSISSIVLSKLFYKQEGEPLPLMLCFGASNIIFGLLVIFGFYFRCGKPKIEFPTRNEYNAIKPFAFQTILQWLFSQGERIVLIASNTPEQIGVYGFVSDISSLIARLVFAPIEAAVFSMCASSAPLQFDMYSLIVRIVVYIGLCAAAFGPPLAPVVLQTVYSKRWSGDDSKSAMSWFLRIMPFMAFNGVTEAFSNARLSEKSLMYYNILLAIVSSIYFGLIFYFSKIFGTQGAIMANGVNMILRSIMAITVISREFKNFFSLFPNIIQLIAFGSLIYFQNSIRILYVLILAPFYGLMILFFERHSIKKLWNSLKSKKRD